MDRAVRADGQGYEGSEGKSRNRDLGPYQFVCFFHREQIDLIVNSCIYIYIYLYISVDMLNVKCLL